MAGVYATIDRSDEPVQIRLADILELRAADLQQRAMLEDYLADLQLSPSARVLEIGDNDPLQVCAGAAVETLVHDRHLVRRLPGLLREAGFELVRVRSHGYVEAAAAHYMLTLVERGADALVAQRRLGASAAQAIKTVAAARVAEGRFFGHIAYSSVIARKAARA